MIRAKIIALCLLTLAAQASCHHTVVCGKGSIDYKHQRVDSCEGERK
jgi:hypothetical protein